MIKNKKLITPTTLGKYYEAVCLSHLTHNFNLNLLKVGGKNDKGIDLQGHSNINKSLYFIVQCKCMNKKLEPKYIRELQGTLVEQFFKSYLGRNERTPIGILCSPLGFSTNTINSAVSSQLPLCLFQISLCGKLVNCLFNRKAEDIFLDCNLKLVKLFDLNNGQNSLNVKLVEV